MAIDGILRTSDRTSRRRVFTSTASWSVSCALFVINVAGFVDIELVEALLDAVKLDHLTPRLES